MQRTNEEKLDLFADLLEPAAEIFSDPAIAEVFRSGGKTVTAVKIAIKNHKAAVIEILARIDGIPVEEYKVNVVALPMRLIALINQPELKSLFSGQIQTAAASSGSATDSTKDGAN